MWDRSRKTQCVCLTPQPHKTPNPAVAPSPRSRFVQNSLECWCHWQGNATGWSQDKADGWASTPALCQVSNHPRAACSKEKQIPSFHIRPLPLHQLWNFRGQKCIYLLRTMHRYHPSLQAIIVIQKNPFLHPSELKKKKKSRALSVHQFACPVLSLYI